MPFQLPPSQVLPRDRRRQARRIGYDRHVRYVGVAALAALFWISVVMVRGLIEPPPLRVHPALQPTPQRTPTARIDAPVPPLQTIEHLSDADLPPRDEPVIPRATRLVWPDTSVSGRTQAAVDRAMVGLYGLIDSCRSIDDPPAVFRVKAVVHPDGRVWSAEVKGKRAGSIAARCVEEGFLSLKFPPATADVTIHHRIRLYRYHVSPL